MRPDHQGASQLSQTGNDSISIGSMVGSLRAASFSRLLAANLPGLAPQDVKVAEMASTGDLPHLNVDLLADGVPAPVALLAAQIAQVDGVVIVTPEYNWSFPGVLKNALDWMSRMKPLPLQGKPVMVITNSPGLLGGARTHEPLRQVLHSLDCRVMVKPEIQVTQVAGKVDAAAGTIKDAATAAFLAERMAEFAAFIRAGRTASAS